MEKIYALPALSLVLLTFIVMYRITKTRFPEMRSKKIRPQSLASRKEVSLLIEDSRASDNFMNLFELPVLFYFLTALIVYFKLESSVLLIFMWLFVIFRVIHSYIHCTTNNVMHRFKIFFASTFCLFSVFMITVFKIYFN